MSDKIAFITGVTGQDGSYLAEFLLSQNYIVHGIAPPSTLADTQNIDPLLQRDRFHFHAANITDASRLYSLLNSLRPNEVYNLAGQTHVHDSFNNPDSTLEVNAMGTLRLLEAIRNLNLLTCRFYQASSSELYGNPVASPQDEKTPFNPCSAYAISKMTAYQLTHMYRYAYGVHANNGILFNHESPRRGYAFVTRKVTRAVAAITLGQQPKLTLGNLDAERDWGHARDYVEGMWHILQQPAPDDYVLATGQTRTIRKLVETAFACVGREIHWRGFGVHEKGLDSRTKEVLVDVDPKLFRPADVQHLCGKSEKAYHTFGWKPRISFSHLIQEMVDHDLKEKSKEQEYRHLQKQSFILKVAES